jgi:hypothetical protein
MTIGFANTAHSVADRIGAHMWPLAAAALLWPAHGIACSMACR